MDNATTPPLYVLVEAREVMRQIKALPVAQPMSHALWLRLNRAVGELGVYVDRQLADQQEVAGAA